jgi:anti-sigma B factor antagonist
MTSDVPSTNGPLRTAAKDQPEFDILVQRSAGTAVVRVIGELDIATAPVLADALTRLEAPCDRVVLDLSGLTFIDSTGLRLAITEHRRAVADGFDFAVAGATGPVLDVLQLTGLDVALPMAPDVTAALGDSATRTNGGQPPAR